MRVHDDGRGQKHRGSAANTSQCSQATVHPANGIFDTNILISFYLMLFVQVSTDSYLVWLSNKEDREQDWVRVLMTSSLVQCHTPVLIAVTKFKTTKINSEGLLWLSTKITCHTVVKERKSKYMYVCVPINTATHSSLGWVCLWNSHSTVAHLV